MNSSISPQKAEGSDFSTGSRNAKPSVIKRGRPSRSSRTTLQCRAMESLRPAEEQVCHDTLALKFMGAVWVKMARNRFMKRLLIRQLDRDYTGMYGFIVARTRYIDEFLKAQIEEGIKQLVILGAGYDSRAYRFNQLQEGVKVFEVDQPYTQRLKLWTVGKALGSFPRKVVYVPIDFASEKLEVNLPKGGYQGKLKTLFIWEGVTMYLTAQAVDRTLAFIAGASGEGSSVVFDYLFESALDGTSGLREAEKLRRNCARMREPLLFGIKDNTIEEFLSSRGFSLLENVTAKSLKDAYFKGKAQQRKIFPLQAIACAKVRHQQKT
jgi:methyltransferase (TIGR00027 family)